MTSTRGSSSDIAFICGSVPTGGGTARGRRKRGGSREGHSREARRRADAAELKSQPFQVDGSWVEFFTASDSVGVWIAQARIGDVVVLVTAEAPVEVALVSL